MDADIPVKIENFIDLIKCVKEKNNCKEEPEKENKDSSMIVEIDGDAIYRPLGNLTELIPTVTCMVLKAKASDRRTSSPLPR
ncbi:hypothetical protein TNCV_4210531 [Trichonephila clavipes]|nr:hypothetical protein TNCV_4210531 [Trichonephila clavipes]